jgi:hypothetical protein
MAGGSNGNAGALTLSAYGGHYTASERNKKPEAPLGLPRV